MVEHGKAHEFQYTGVGVAIGAGVGATVGGLVGGWAIALGLGCGAGVGVAVGAAMDARRGPLVRDSGRSPVGDKILTWIG